MPMHFDVIIAFSTIVFSHTHKGARVVEVEVEVDVVEEDVVDDEVEVVDVDVVDASTVVGVVVCGAAPMLGMPVGGPTMMRKDVTPTTATIASTIRARIPPSRYSGAIFKVLIYCVRRP
jgi:hypothetical protein